MALPETDRDSGNGTTSQPANGGGWAQYNGQQRDLAHSGPVTEATLQELIGRLINDVSALVDKQVELAKQEIREEIGQAISAARTLAIGAGIAVVAGLMLLIWAWTGFIWLINWIGALLFGPWGSWIGWLVGLIVPLVVVWIAYRGFVRPGIAKVKITPLSRTRTTLKEDLEWVRQARTPTAR